MIAKVLLLAALLMVGGCAVAADDRPDYAKAKRTAHHLVIDVTTTCSATAVGPNAILTASHCLEEAKVILIGGTKVEWTILADDGNDHVLVRVSLKFDHWAKRGPAPAQGDVAFMHGNPSVYRDILRVGYFAGTIETFGIFDLEATMGDSGAAMFDTKGRIIGMLSAIQTLPLYEMAISFSFRFSEDQWLLARE